MLCGGMLMWPIMGQDSVAATSGCYLPCTHHTYTFLALHEPHVIEVKEDSKADGVSSTWSAAVHTNQKQNWGNCVVLTQNLREWR